jgi:hypothetical protein
MNLIALPNFNLDFVIPSAARNLLVFCATAHAQVAWSSPDRQLCKGRREVT